MAIGVKVVKADKWDYIDLSSWKLNTGSAPTSTSYSSLNDNSDTTYIYNAAAGGRTMQPSVGAATLAAGEYVRRVRYAVKMKRRTSSSKVTVQMGYYGAPQSVLAQFVGTNKAASAYDTATTYTGSQAAATWVYGPWIETVAGTPLHYVRDYLSVAVKDYAVGSNASFIYEVWAEVEVAQAPSVTVDAPATGSTVSNTSNPTLSWTFSANDSYSYTTTNKGSSTTTRTLTFASHQFAVGQTITVDLADANYDGTYTITGVTATTITYTAASYTQATTAATGTVTASLQEQYTSAEVKVFTAAQYGAGGFSPDTSTATVSLLAAGGLSGSVGYLANSTTYRAYVRGSKLWGAGSGAAASDWAYTQFTVSLTLPAAPSLSSAAWDSTNQRTTLTLTTGASAGTYVSPLVTLERSEDGGTSWTSVYGYRSVSLAFGSVVLSVNDPFGNRAKASLQYRAKVAAQFSSADPNIVEAYSSTASVTPSSDAAWWLKAVANSALNLGGVAVRAEIGTSKNETVGVFTPIGRTSPVVVAGDLYGWDGSYRVFTKTSAQRAAMDALVAHQGTLLVQDPFGEQRYVRVIGRKATLLAGAVPTNPLTEWELEFVEVAAP